jgi:PAS domain S-box-containing protein
MKILNHTWMKSVHYNQMKEELTRKKGQMSVALDFVKAIIAGNLETDIKVTGAQEMDNHLSASLLQMRDQMKKLSTEEKQRHWITEGLAKFGEVLRQRNNNMKVFSDLIISSLVKYMNTNQGALYLINEDNPADVYIELTGCYAYGRKKHIEQRIELGEGLTGQVALEKSTLYMTSLPQDYIKITSGLGEALPRNLLIVPLKLEGKVLGLVEVASFEIMQPYQIEFVERLAESIASTVVSVRVAERTQQLLNETQTQAEQMRAQEEEMRQSMEELTATQEEMQRILKEVQAQERYMNELIDSSSDSILVIDRAYKVVSANKTLRATYGNLGIDVVKGLDANRLFEGTDWPKYKAFYDRTFEGETFSRTELFESHGFKLYFLSQHTPMRDQEGNIVASVVFAKDVTELVNAQKSAEELALDQQQKNEELKAQEEELRQNMEELSAIQDQMQHTIGESQRKEQYLNDIINVSSDIVFTIDNAYRLISFNKAMESGMEKLGLRVTKGFCMLDIFNGSERNVQQVYYDRAFSGECYERTEHFTHSGLDVYTIVSYAPLINELGDTYAVAVFSKDVSEVHRTLNEVSRKERELDEIVNASADPIWTLDTNHSLMTFNKGFAFVFGARNIEVAKGMNMITVLPQAEQKAQLDIYNRVFSGEQFSLIQTFTHNSEESHVAISYSPIRDEKGIVTGATVYTRNVTETVNTERLSEKRVSEAKFQQDVLLQKQKELDMMQQKIELLETRDLVYSQSLLYLEMNASGQILEVNNKMVEISGAARENLVGKSYRSFCDVPAGYFTKCCRSLVTGLPWRGICRNLNAAGVHFYSEITVAPHQDTDGKVAEVLCSGYILPQNLGEELYNRQLASLGLGLTDLVASERQKNKRTHNRSMKNAAKAA